MTGLHCPHCGAIAPDYDWRAGHITGAFGDILDALQKWPDLSRVTAPKIRAVTGLNPYQFALVLSNHDTSWSRLKRNEIDRRITLCMDHEPPSVAIIKAACGLSTSAVYINFKRLYGRPPDKCCAKYRDKSSDAKTPD